jgi:hypothetical protein
MKAKRITFIVLLVVAPLFSFSDIVLDNFENDRSNANGAGIDAYWNPPPVPPFQVEIEKQKVHSGTAALKVSWQNKDLWPHFVIGKLQMEETPVISFTMPKPFAWRSPPRRKHHHEVRRSRWQ